MLSKYKSIIYNDLMLSRFEGNRLLYSDGNPEQGDEHCSKFWGENSKFTPCLFLMLCACRKKKCMDFKKSLWWRRAQDACSIFCNAELNMITTLQCYTMLPACLIKDFSNRFNQRMIREGFKKKLVGGGSAPDFPLRKNKQKDMVFCL